MIPRISAIMPTADRRRFVPAAIAQFLAQERADAELVILDDGADSVADLIPGDRRVRYFREEAPRILGDKRNRLCSLARGEVIVHWDDDDWHAPDRLARQLAALDASGADIVGLDQIAFLADDGAQAWDYRWGGRQRWIYGASMAYRRSYWKRRRFPAIRTGEDTRFVLDARDAQIVAMADTDWLVARVHGGNTSPKRTRGGYWTERTPAPLRERIACWSGRSPPEAVAPIANVYALLAHERPECVVDLVRNLRWHDPVSPILVYDGSAGGTLIDPKLPWARWGVEIVPAPRPMKWGKLHDFALDCIRHLGMRDYDALTIVDSDQMQLRSGYPEFLAGQGGIPGILSSDPRPQGRATRIPPARTAQGERALWQPLLDRFEDGDAAFVHWSFWPGTVIGADCGRAIAALFEDAQLQGILGASKLWATEEILFPTLARLLGFPVQQNPCRGDWTQYRRRWSLRDLDAARGDARTFWMHPVPRALDDPLRRHLRASASQYRRAPPAPVTGPVSADAAILAEMRALPGWLSDAEANAVLSAARAALARDDTAGHLVEIGSHCGKATLLLGRAAEAALIPARVTAIDRFDGVTGSREDRLVRDGVTRGRFDQMLAGSGLGPWISARTGEACEFSSGDPVDLLLIDGLHDYPAVATDFAAFEAALTPGARVAFHDYADYFPGVAAFVDELVATGGWEIETAVETLRILRRSAPVEQVASHLLEVSA
ncbi:glycosyltransferase [Sphingomonas sp. HF-S4]|uniref:Glycosyltransferase n=1 Tax=Sphingomonas agrestis TaxID=3080540 RepID=A0ABU3Y574_9SPHN|nr:glycosyltransferase [Sphingomonas sp. HF-S4]MDV3456338.1 glycosyltransferase [Sphingomonas sp. HF-S4]